MEASAVTGSHIVSIGRKPVVARRAVATGSLLLSKEAVVAIRERKLEKGDAIAAAEVAGLAALKRTPDLLPFCHPIRLTGSELRIEPADDRVHATCVVEAEDRTGVEMEALVGVTTALLAVWDMVKSLEKDAAGQYPRARITDVRVVSKEKSPPAEG